MIFFNTLNPSKNRKAIAVPSFYNKPSPIKAEVSKSVKRKRLHYYHHGDCDSDGSRAVLQATKGLGSASFSVGSPITPVPSSPKPAGKQTGTAIH